MKSRFLILVLVLWSVAGCASAAPRVSMVPQATANQAGAANGAGTDPVIISRNVPAYASSGTAADANSSDYNTTWRSIGTKSWLAYDLSRVPPEQASVLLVWYNPSTDYDNTIIQEYSYNVPEDYTIDVNTAPGGGAPPASGWATRVTVTGNHYHSRQHVIDMRGDNWVRIDVTAVDGAPENYDSSIKMDVYDAAYGLANDWIFYGDSITAESMVNYSDDPDAVPGFAQLIHNQDPAQFPVQEDGGIGYLASADGAKYLPTWLAIFPGKYVGLSYGTNDALGCVDPTAFWNNYVAMVQDVLKAGKVPVIPHIPWGRDPNLQSCVPPLNAKIDALYVAYPEIIRGPDLYGYFKSHQSLISSDNIHPTDAGAGAYREQWATAMVSQIYAR